MKRNLLLFATAALALRPESADHVPAGPRHARDGGRGQQRRGRSRIPPPDAGRQCRRCGRGHRAGRGRQRAGPLRPGRRDPDPDQDGRQAGDRHQRRRRGAGQGHHRFLRAPQARAVGRSRADAADPRARHPGGHGAGRVRRHHAGARDVRHQVVRGGGAAGHRTGRRTGAAGNLRLVHPHEPADSGAVAGVARVLHAQRHASESRRDVPRAHAGQDAARTGRRGEEGARQARGQDPRRARTTSIRVRWRSAWRISARRTAA